MPVPYGCKRHIPQVVYCHLLAAQQKLYKKYQLLIVLL